MSCNCKNKSKKDTNKILKDLGIRDNESDGTDKINRNPLELVLIFIAKTIGFLVGSVLLILIIVPYIIYYLFKTLYFDASIDISELIIYISKKLSLGDYKEIKEEEVN